MLLREEESTCPRPCKEGNGERRAYGAVCCSILLHIFTVNLLLHYSSFSAFESSLRQGTLLCYNYLVFHSLLVFQVTHEEVPTAVHALCIH